MTTQLDRELRDALEDLATAPPPTGLAGRAVRQAVRRRRAMNAASALACLALVGTAAAVLSDPDRHVPAPAPSPEVGAPLSTNGQYVITALSYAAADSNVVRSLVLNLHTDRYEDLPYRTALPSPDGARVAVVDGTDPTQPPARLGVLSLATGQVEWVPGSLGLYPVDWSPDGRRLLLTHSSEREQLEFAILDVADLTRSPQRQRADVDPIWVAWGPDGESLLIPQLEADRIRAIVRVGLDGRRQSSIPVDAPIVHPGLLVTADGTRALVATASNRGIVVDTVTGATMQVPLAGRPLAWVGNHWLLAQVGDGLERSTHSLSLIDLNGAVTQRVRALLHPDVIYEVWVGSSAGLGPMSRHLAF